VGDAKGKWSKLLCEDEKWCESVADVERVQQELALPPGWEAVYRVTRTLKKGEKYHLVYV